jgi:hypothetical protein
MTRALRKKRMYPSITVSNSHPDPLRIYRRVSACLTLMLFAIGAAWSKPPAKSGASAKASAKSSPAAAPSSASESPRLDSAQVHRLYLDGEFDAAIAILEENLKETRQYRHEDSVFIFKHLGVMYTAQYETREKGKYYMHKLLSVEPGARIMDMYASDMIYMIFKNIQEEYEQSRMYHSLKDRKDSRADSMSAGGSRSGADEAGKRPERAAQAKPEGGRKWLWTGVTVAAVAAGVGAYYIFSADPQTTIKEKDTPF